jgi:hypothetical protein
MLSWALLASGLINTRKLDGWQTLALKLIDQPIDLAARNDTLMLPKIAPRRIPITPAAASCISVPLLLVSQYTACQKCALGET